MEVQPVRKYKAPGYPDKERVLRNPGILKTVPERWKGNMQVATAFSILMAMTLTACGQKWTPGGEAGGNTRITDGVTRTAGGNATQSKTEMKVKGAAAPVFEHGSGRGSFGCVSVAPPSFLSEEEAFEVVREEAAKYGINFEKEGLSIKNVRIPETKYYLKPENADAGYKEDGGAINSTRRGELSLDGYDKDRGIAFEFVSATDYEAWKVDQSVRSSVDDYDFLSAAKLLRDGMEGKTDGAAVGTFYNSMFVPDMEEIKKAEGQEGFKNLETAVKSRAEEDLRSQVRDFLEWLKAQEII